MKIRHYSGPESKWFWRRVKRLSAQPFNRHGELYSLGCALQDLEGRVMNTLETAEEEIRHHKRTKRSR